LSATESTPGGMTASITIFTVEKNNWMNISIRGRLMDFSRPRVMGIINITDDSFYAGSRHTAGEEILATAMYA
jgi:hypothetical protein